MAQRIVAFFTGAQQEYAAQAFPELTVGNHVSSILLKLQVSDRTAAAIKARDAGLGSG